MNRRPITGRFDVAIIPCGGAKNPAPSYRELAASELYKGTPFKLNLKHAQLRAHRVLIMSAHYGLLDLTDPVEPYEAYLPDLDTRQRWSLLQRIKDQYVLKQLFRVDRAGGQFVSYLPKAYQQALDEAIPWLTTSRPYVGFNMLKMVGRLNQEIKDVSPIGR